MQKMNSSGQINNMMERFQDWKHELDRAISAFKEISGVEEDFELEDDIEDMDEDEPNPSLILKMKKAID